MRKVIAFLAAAVLASAASASFSPQGAEALKTVAGRRIPGVGLTEVIICTTGPDNVFNGLVYQTAVRNGLSPMAPTVAGATLNRVAATSFWSLAMNGVTDLGALAAALGASGVIKMDERYITGLALARPAMDIAKIRLSARIPDPVPFSTMLLDPTKVTAFPGPGCEDRLMVTKYVPGQKDLLGPFPIQ